MARGKKDMARQNAKLKTRLVELEEKCKRDPLKKNPKIHEELEKLRKKLK